MQKALKDIRISMAKSTGRIIKASNVRMDGHFRISTGGTSSGTTGKAAPASPGAALQVNIVETQADYAVLEVTCSCGTKTHIKCEYGNANQ